MITEQALSVEKFLDARLVVEKSRPWWILLSEMSYTCLSNTVNFQSYC